MNKLKKIVLLAAICVFSALMVACSGPLEKTTIYYSYGTSPADNYFRLTKSGRFIKILGSMVGDYEVSGDTVTFLDDNGGTFKGYIVGDNLLYGAYDGKKDKVPSGDKFDLEVTDGRRTTMTFKSDGTMERYIGQANIYDYTLLGTYERKGNLIICTYKTKDGGSYSTGYGIRKGVIYDCYTSDVSVFTEKEQSAIAKLDIPKDNDTKTNSKNVVIFAVVSIVVVIIAFCLIFLRKKKPTEEENS